MGNPHLVSVPHRNGGLSGGHTITAGQEVRARLQAVLGEFQTHEAELYLTARTDDVLTTRFVVLHLLTTGGTGSDGGTLDFPLHLREDGGLAVLDELQVEVDAPAVVAAVRARSGTFPWLQTLPAELVGGLLACSTDGALHAKVREVFPFHIRLTARTLLTSVRNIKGIGRYFGKYTVDETVSLVLC